MDLILLANNSLQAPYAKCNKVVDDLSTGKIYTNSPVYYFSQFHYVSFFEANVK